MGRANGARFAVIAIIFGIAAAAGAQYADAADSGGTPDFQLPDVVVVGVSPVLGTGIPLNQVPANVQTIDQKLITNQHSQSISDAINQNVGSAIMSNTEGNPFQPDLELRGFTASPVLGTPEGLAVYQNGVRVNEPFGDLVLWDLIPTFAVDRLQIIPGSNPVFGLNALGGAVTMEMKNGFSFQGGQADFSVGSFGRRQETLEYGTQYGNIAAYTGEKALHDDGWRQHSPSDLLQSFSDLAARKDGLDLGVSLSMAASSLSGVGPTPEEQLAQDRSAVFTFPDNSRDRLVFLQFRGDDQLTDTLSVQGNAYFRHSGVRIENGNASGFAPCTDDDELLCENVGQPNETRLTELNGGLVPSSLVGTGVDDVIRTITNGGGGSIQTTLTEPILGFNNTAILGASFDYGNSEFNSVDQLGNLKPNLQFSGDGILLGTDEYNTRLNAVNTYYGLYGNDTLSLTDALSATLAGRVNIANLTMTDQFGTALTGNHNYGRFNPSAGLTYQLSKSASLYMNYGEANRIPTAAELACADPTTPCRFPAGFIADPSLQQVVARTVELGGRGQVLTPPILGHDLVLNWSADAYGSRNQNDIIFVSSGPFIGSGFFRNAGMTQRLGLEASLDGKWAKFSWFVHYALTDATYGSHLTILSPSNPGADANGNIFVKPGDRLPGIPLHTAKLGVRYDVTNRWNVEFDGILASSQYLRGDEANLQKPLAGYGVFNVLAGYSITKDIELYFEAENVFDHKYNTFGIYGDPTTVFPNFTDNRFVTPGQPLGFWAGIRARF